MSMLCGDETGPLVLDMGSRSFKFGFGGEDAPKGWINSAVGLDNSGNKRHSLLHQSMDTQVLWAKEDGKVKDWDITRELWSQAIEHDLNSKPSEHPILIASPTNEDDHERAKMAELMFEDFNVPALFLARNAQLSAFSVGRASAMIVDIGSSGATAAAVHDGFVLRKTISKSCVGGDWVDEHMMRVLETGLFSEDGKESVPFKVSCLLKPGDGTRKMIDRPAEETSKIHSSYIRYKKLDQLVDLKTRVCRVWSELNFDESLANMYVKETYELPDGTVIHMGADRFKSPELLVNPFYDPGFAKEHSVDSALIKSIQQIIYESLMASHADLRREMSQQILLVGGASLLPGTVERVTKELTKMLPGALKPRILVPGNPERLFSTFIGGSILASLGSFQQLWISKQEFAEFGENIILSRCNH